MPDLSMRTSRQIKAPARKLFEAWLDPAMLTRFMCPAPGMSAPHAATDPHVGGRFDIVMRGPNRDVPIWGVYREIKPFTRLVFSWQNEFLPEDSTVTIDFVETGGVTEVTLTHVKFRSESSRDDHLEGWSHILKTLESEAA